MLSTTSPFSSSFSAPLLALPLAEEESAAASLALEEEAEEEAEDDEEEEAAEKEEEKMRPKRFRIATVIDSYIVLHSFFVRQPISIYFKVFNLLYAPLRVLLVALHIFISFFYHQWSHFFM